MIKRKTAGEVLTDSFKELSRSKPVNKITIKDIAENCGYSTATFYREFKDKYDLIATDYAKNLARIMDRIGKSGYRWNQTLTDGARMFKEQKPYIVNLLSHTSGRESFEECIINANYRSLKAAVENSSANTGEVGHLDLYIKLYCMGTVKLCCEWLTDKFTALPDEIAGVWEKSLPAPLRPYLYT